MSLLLAPSGCPFVGFISVICDLLYSNVPCTVCHTYPTDEACNVQGPTKWLHNSKHDHAALFLRLVAVLIA
jgi:hypothetical protein